MPRWCLPIACVFLLAVLPHRAAGVDYLREIKPLLAEHCYACHGPLRQQAQLRLDTAAAARAGGDSGPALAAGDSAASLLYTAAAGTAGFRMPPEGEGTPLSAAQLATLKAWIDEGAVAPPDEPPAADPGHWWSYQPVRRPPLPTVAHPERLDNPIDFFLEAQRERQGLTARAPADRAVLLRRLYLDLIGIPPTPEELQAWLDDPTVDACDRLVDRLLASPLHGQRWGRHWMDVWRYSDWYGSRAINEIRYSQRHIWRWRDWIVESVNRDLGYDQMLVQMLAGDELAPGDPNVMRATGFLGRNWYKFDRNAWMVEAVEQTCQAFLGLTMKCARCHDHKFDPISQRDYYRFRAFLEPHDVRTDPVSANLATEKDATLGQVLKAGISSVYDKQLDAPTWLFERGDSRYPDKSEVLTPGVPAAFGTPEVPIQPLALPEEAIAPMLRADLLRELRQAAQVTVAEAEHQQRQAQSALELARARWADRTAPEASALQPPPRGTWFTDTFSVAPPDFWRVVGGHWEWGPSGVRQSQPAAFATLVAPRTLPRNFTARWRYTTLEIGELHSIGFFFDVVELRDCQAIYTATNSRSSTVQAFHRQGGVEHYPAEGIVPFPLQVNQEITVDMAVRESLLNVWVNGELAIVYRLPLARQPGTFALWTHAGGALFHELSIDPLADEFHLAEHRSEATRSPYELPRADDMQGALQLAEFSATQAALRVQAAQAEGEALSCRIEADQARIRKLPDAQPKARQAAIAERQARLLQAQVAALEAEHRLKQVEGRPAEGEAQAKALAEAQQQQAAATKAVADAQAAAEKDDADYTPLGPHYPETSSGRRLALARWMVQPEHPRTARVAVNHLWLRHFGEALVPTVANFGLNGQVPSHPDLLDWLAADFVSHDWSMKRAHRRLVTSAAYRMSSSESAEDADNVRQDPDNRFLWRQNSRRMESEIVRDSILHLAGRLDLSFGGPEIDERQGQASPRRSLYFRSTPNERMSFLELFDQANPNECYRRQESVVPQQALALSNSLLTLNQARELARTIEARAGREGALPAEAFIAAAFAHVLSRAPTSQEQSACLRFLARQAEQVERGGTRYPAANPSVTAAGLQPQLRARENLVHVLLNHHEFVTIR